MFVPEDLGLYAKIKASDARDGHEAEILWNAGFNIEMALAAMHKVTEAVAEGHLARVTDFESVLNHFLQHSYLRLQERRDFFADAVENGKNEAILLQKISVSAISRFHPLCTPRPRSPSPSSVPRLSPKSSENPRPEVPLAPPNHPHLSPKTSRVEKVVTERKRSSPGKPQ